MRYIYFFLIFVITFNSSIVSTSFAKDKNVYSMSCFLIGDTEHLDKKIKDVISMWNTRWERKGLISSEFDLKSGMLTIKTKTEDSRDRSFVDLKRRLAEINIQLYRSIGL